MAETALITGAAGTIGRAAARMLAGQGYRLILADKQVSAIEALPGSRTVALDVADANAVSALFDMGANDLNAVVLAAGMEGPIGNFEECPDAAFDAVMTANVKTVWLGIKNGLRVLKPAKRGSIVALASISGTMGMSQLAPYCASKHAVIGLVRTAAREAARHGVRVNAVCPGPVASVMMDRIDEALANRRSAGDAARAIPMQRYAEPEEVAHAIAYLCSDASRYTTGSTLTVDGGYSCR